MGSPVRPWPGVPGWPLGRGRRIPARAGLCPPVGRSPAGRLRSVFDQIGRRIFKAREYLIISITQPFQLCKLHPRRTRLPPAECRRLGRLRPGWPKGNGALVPLAGTACDGTSQGVNSLIHMIARSKTASPVARPVNPAWNLPFEAAAAWRMAFGPGPARELMICLGWLRLFRAVVWKGSAAHPAPRRQDNLLTTGRRRSPGGEP